MKKNIFLALTVIFAILTLLGMIYVLLNHGTHSAGYAVVPMIFALTFWEWYRKIKQ